MDFQTISAVLIILGSSRLVILENLKPIGLYTIEKNVKVYTSIEADKMSFSMTLDEFFSNNVLINGSLGLLNKLRMKGINENDTQNVLLLENQIVQSTRYLKRTNFQFAELTKYRDNETVMQNMPCHIDFKHISLSQSMQLYSLNLVSLKESVVNANKQQVNDPKSGEYIQLRNTYQIILESTEFLFDLVSKYVRDVQSLKNGIITDSLFTTLKESKCIDEDPYMDLVSIDECRFYPTNVTCIITVETPRQPQKLGNLLPIPYLNYELDLSNVYHNYSSKELTHVECKHNTPVLYNCITKPFDEKCAHAVKSNSLSEPLKYCTFKESKFSIPKVTLNGILIPYQDDLRILKYNDSENGTALEFDTEHKSPILLRNSERITILDKLFKYTFSAIANSDELVYSKYTLTDIIDFAATFELLLNLSDEHITTIYQSSIGVIALIAWIISCTCFYKLRKTTMNLKRFESRHPRPKQSKRLRKFLRDQN